MKRISTATDRRVAIRVLAGIPVKVRVKDLPSSVPTSFSAETADLSSRGASLLLKNSLPVSSRISLTLDLAFPLPRLETDATVLWNYFLPRDKKFNCGVQFSGLKKEYKRILREFTKAKNNLGEAVPERRRIERRKGERRTTAIPDYASNRRRVRKRRSFDRRQALMRRFFRKLINSVVQLLLPFKKKDIEP